MSDETGNATGAAETAPETAGAPAPEGGQVEGDGSGQGGEVREGEGLSAEELATIAAGAPGDSGSQADTIRIGDVDVPREALVALLGGEDGDAILGQIKRTLRAGGEDIEISLLDALAEVPKAKGWQKRQWQAAEAEKRLDEIAGSMGTDIVGAYAKLHGVSMRQATDAVADQVIRLHELEKMTPEERATADAQTELERKAARHDELERERDAETAQVDMLRARKRLVPMVHTALAAAGVPKSRHALARVAGIVSAAMDQGVIKGEAQPEHLEWAAQLVAEERTEERTAYYGDADGDELLALVGKEQARKIAKAVAKLWGRTAPSPRKPEGTGAPRDPNKGAADESFGAWKRRANDRMRR